MLPESQRVTQDPQLIVSILNIANLGTCTPGNWGPLLMRNLYKEQGCEGWGQGRKKKTIARSSPALGVVRLEQMPVRGWGGAPGGPAQRLATTSPHQDGCGSGSREERMLPKSGCLSEMKMGSVIVHSAVSCYVPVTPWGQCHRTATASVWNIESAVPLPFWPPE